MTLTGCGGGADGETAEPSQSLKSVPSQRPISTETDFLSQYFIESLAPYTAAAEGLREHDARYTYQDIYWYSDLNANGRRDGEAEPIYNTYPLASSRVDYAHATGLSGSGAVIAITDDGFYTDHEIFDKTSYITATDFNPTSHGTTVASIIAGNSDRMIGLAPNVNLILGSYDTATTRTDIINAAIANDAIAINNSWGFVLDANDTNYAAFDASNSSYLDALRTYSQSGVVVFAAANDRSRTGSTLMEALPRFDASLQNGWIAVVSGIPTYDDTGVTSVNLQSAGCFEAAQWCITADGSWRGATNSGTSGYAFNTGTSFAAPMVSGSLALLSEAFPDLTPHELRVRLLASADSDFAEFTPDGSVELAEDFFRQYSDTYGLGFLDVSAALLPIGDVQTTLSNGQRHDVSTPVIVNSAASGDAITRALQNRSVMVEDQFSGEFVMPANALVMQTSARPALARLKDHASHSHDTWSFLQQGAGIASNVTHIPMGDFHIAFSETASHHSQITRGLGIGQRFNTETSTYTLSFGHISDRGTVLPQDTSFDDTRIIGIGLKGDHVLDPRTQLGWSGQIGYAPASEMEHGGRRSDTLVSEFGMYIQRTGFISPHDRLRLSVSAPIAVMSGDMTLPLMETRDGKIHTDPIKVDLSPSQREIDISLNYSAKLSERAYLSAGLAHLINHGHQAGAQDTGVMISFGMTF